MLIALVLLNVVHPGQVMPGKDSDLPSRKDRKVIGKKNVRGRMAGELPLYDFACRTRVAEADLGAERKATYPEVGDKMVSIGYVG